MPEALDLDRLAELDAARTPGPMESCVDAGDVLVTYGREGVRIAEVEGMNRHPNAAFFAAMGTHGSALIAAAKENAVLAERVKELEAQLAAADQEIRDTRESEGLEIFCMSCHHLPHPIGACPKVSRGKKPCTCEGGEAQALLDEMHAQLGGCIYDGVVLHHQAPSID